ncbi:hypothetical protein L0F63_005604 [Massospora cicadina]|nr:hypothetical protein L0F63_005604 [Massospora cicadina]
MVDEKLKVLVRSSAATRSHMAATLAISEELAKRGHSVTFAAMDGFLKFAADYNLTLVSLGKSTESERVGDIDEIRHNSLQASANFLSERYDEEVKSLAKLMESVDIVMCDHLAFACMDLAKVKGKPLVIGYQPMSILDQRKPSYFTANMNPSPITTSAMSFVDRLRDQIKAYKVKRDTDLLKEAINKKRLEYGMPTTLSLVDEMDYGLSLANTFMGMEPAHPIHPTVRLIGPILEKSRYFDNNVQSFLNSCEPCLYIAFGSIFPLNIADINLISTAILLAIENRVIKGAIWALGKTNIDQIPKTINLHNQTVSFKENPKILIMPWAPQQQILAHPNVRAFLSHGGMSSINEALYYAKPILGMSYIHDQPKNLAKLQAKGVGIYLSRHSLTPNFLKEKIDQLLHTPKLHLQMMQIMAIYGAKRLTHAASMVEEHAYLAKSCRPLQPYHPHHNLPPCELAHLIPAGDLMPFKTNNIDIYLVIFVSAISLSYMVYAMVRQLKGYVHRKLGLLKLKAD